MKQARLKEIFDIKYGGKFTKTDDYPSGRTPVIKSQATNNGVIGFFDIQNNNTRAISVARTGSIGASFFHDYPCYITDDCMVLQPKIKMCDKTMLVYARIVQENSSRYNYSRKITPSRLGSALVPEPKDMGKRIASISIPKRPSIESVSDSIIPLNDEELQWFKYSDIFEIKKGYYNKEPPAQPYGDIPYIGATRDNNGVTSYCNVDDIRKAHRNGSHEEVGLLNGKIFEAPCVTISNGGSIGNAFYQSKPFACAHHINPVYLKNGSFNSFIGIFLCALIELEKYRYSTCGREWRLDRMPNSEIRLPVDEQGNPDWQFMEDYIKSLPYSKNLESA